jgi:thiol-disulfide isomerase/thioredoxin
VNPAAALVAVVAATLLLAGCAAQDGLGAAGVPVTATATSSAAPVTGSTSTADPALVAKAGLAPCPRSGDHGAVAGGLPDVVLPCLGEGPAVRLAGVRGVPMVLNVWASWCEPCRAELPVLAEASARYGDAVRFLGVDQADDADAALELLATSGVHYPSVSDPENESRAGLRSIGLPVTLLVRADGTVAHRVEGAVDSVAGLEALISEHLGVPAASGSPS